MQVKNYSYDEKKILGEGSFGKVYEGINTITQEQVVIKVITRVNKEAIGEIDALKKLYEDGDSSRYTMKYYDSFIEGEKLYLVLEYIQGRNLLWFLYRQFRHYSGDPVNVWALIYQLLLGLKYIHGKGMAHLDIAERNILITSGRLIKYIDFGISCVIKCPYEHKDCQNLCYWRDRNISKIHFPEFRSYTASNSDTQPLTGEEALLFGQWYDLIKLINVIETVINLANNYSDDGRLENFYDKLRLMFKLDDEESKETRYSFTSEEGEYIFVSYTIWDVLRVFKEEVLTPPWQGKQLTVEQEYSDKATREEKINYVIVALQNGKLTTEYKLNPFVEKKFSTLIGLYGI